jgi:plasmid stabilization system protein ParE
MKSFVFTPLAARDLNEIWDYLAGDSIEAADRVLDAVEKRCAVWQKIPAKATGEMTLPTAGTASSSSIHI